MNGLIGFSLLLLAGSIIFFGLGVRANRRAVSGVGYTASSSMAAIDIPVEHEIERVAREVDQRVKGNLQLIISLSNLAVRRARAVDQIAARQLLLDFQMRLETISIVQKVISARPPGEDILIAGVVEDILGHRLSALPYAVDLDVSNSFHAVGFQEICPISMIVHEIATQAIANEASQKLETVVCRFWSDEDAAGLTIDVTYEPSRSEPLHTDRAMSLEIIQMLTDKIGGVVQETAEEGKRRWELTYGTNKIRTGR
ncbi:MAG: histidine kinase dimerization/phosphoacceptor domain -containing protein [Pseudomonadota bacterium]